MIPHNRLSLGGDDVAAATGVIESGWLAGGGPQCVLLGEEFATRTRRHAGLAVSSGTVALEIALRIVGASGGNVALPAYLCLSAQRAVRRAGCTPVLVDSDPDDLSFRTGTIGEVAHRCTAVIAVHQLGLPAGCVEEIDSCAVPVIEDISTGIGGTVAGSPLGSFGRLAVCSLAASKIVGAGEGGVITGEAPDIGIARQWATPESDLDDDLPVPHARIPELSCAIGRTRLSSLPESLARRSVIAAHYISIAENRGFGVKKPRSGSQGTWYRFLVEVPDRADDFIEHSARLGVTCVKPVVSRGWYGTGDFPVAESLARSIVSVPVFPSLTDNEVEKVGEMLASVMS